MLQDYVPAPFGRRFLAFVIDLSILSMLFNVFFGILILVFLALWGVPDLENLESTFQELPMKTHLLIAMGILSFILVAAFFWHLYFIYFEHVYRKTPGKKALSLFVVSTNGKDLSFRQALLREVFRSYVDMLFVFPGFICMLLTKNKQRVGDLVTDTAVIYSPKLAAEESYLYLSHAQYDFRKEKYKVLDLPREEAEKFLSETKSLLWGQVSTSASEDDFIQRNLVILDPTFEDTQEMKLRFISEYLLQMEKSK